jgi:predicted regulator of Ras-like GTPase activity (Roadblock/LC7/MglB family)
MVFERSAGTTPTLREALRPLLEVEGVLGGVLCSADGLPLAAALKDGLDEDGLAAAGARLGQLAGGCLGDDGLEIAVIDASRLMIVVRPVSLGYLTLAANPLGEMEAAIAAAKQAGATLEEIAAALATAA